MRADLRLSWALAMFAGMFVVFSLTGWVYTNSVQRQADHRQELARREQDRRWCALFATLDRPVPQTIKDPVQRARSEQAQRLFHKLRVDLGCVKE